MFYFLPIWVKGPFSALFFAANTLLWTIILYVFAVLKLLSPAKFIQVRMSRAMAAIGENWISGNNFDIAIFNRIEWDVQGIERLQKNQSYLVCANHQSWTDILILQKIFNRRIPFLRFFLKQELIYVPFLGLAWWALDFPFMKRFSKDQIAKDPRRKRQDLEATRRACEKYQGFPVSVLNFLEGTRYSEEKRKKQKSSYENLLNPKTGGLAYVIASMGQQFHALLDVTIFYPQGVSSVWSFFFGKAQKIVVRVRCYEIPPQMISEKLMERAEDRAQLHAWVKGIWTEKDRLLQELRLREQNFAGFGET